MIYTSQKAWNPSGLRFQKDCSTVLNLSILKNIEKSINDRALQLNQDAKQFRQRFQDGIISIGTLNTKVKILILPYQCFFRNFEPICNDTKNTQPGTPFQFIIKRYDNLLPVGVSVNWQSHQKFIKEFKQKKLFKRVKIISFNIGKTNINNEMQLMRKVVSQTFAQANKTQYMINIQLNKPSDLFILRDELINKGYPLEYICISTNLLNIVKGEDEYEITYRYNEILKKAVPCAVTSVLETFYPKNQTSNEQQLDYFLKIVSCINKRDSEQVRMNKPFYNSGVLVPQCLMLYLIKQYDLNEGQQYQLRAKMDGIGFQNLKKAVAGIYKTLKYQQV